MPHIAVDRCLNEVYQSIYGFIGLNIDFEWTDDAKHNVDFETVFANFNEVLETGSGIWPLSILYSKSSYEYEKPNPNYGISNDTDIRYCLELVKNLGFNIYIRNNSNTGFPTYYTIIPGMSQVLYSKREYERKYGNGILKSANLSPNILNMSKNDIREFAEGVEARYKAGYMIDIARDYFLFNSNDDLLELSSALFLSMLYYYTEDFMKSQEFIKEYIKIHSNQIYSNYFSAVYHYISFFHIEQLPIKEVELIMSNIYGDELTKEVILDMTIPKNIFNYYNLPNCLNVKIVK